MLDPLQAREDARQVRAMLAKFPGEHVYIHREWASRLAEYAERLTRLEEGLANLLVGAQPTREDISAIIDEATGPALSGGI